MNEQRKLTRSRNSMLGGVCAGVAEYTGADVTLVRILTVIAVIIGFGSVALIYIAAWVIMPPAPPAPPV